MKSLGIFLCLVGFGCDLVLVLGGSLRWHAAMGWTLFLVHIALLWLWVWMT